MRDCYARERESDAKYRKCNILEARPGYANTRSLYIAVAHVREIRQLYEVQHEELQQFRECLAESEALQQRDAKLLPSRETLRGTAPSLSHKSF